MKVISCMFFFTQVFLSSGLVLHARHWLLGRSFYFMKVLKQPTRLMRMLELTHYSLMMLCPHDMVRYSQHWFREWLDPCSVPNHYLNQCWFIVNCKGLNFNEVLIKINYRSRKYSLKYCMPIHVIPNSICQCYKQYFIGSGWRIYPSVNWVIIGSHNGLALVHPHGLNFHLSLTVFIGHHVYSV